MIIEVGWSGFLVFRKITASLIVFGMVTLAFADNPPTYTWTGATGDGLWTTGGNWSPEVAGGPGSAHFIFPSGDWTIRRDTDASYHSITLEEGGGTITFVGEGRFQAPQSTVIVIPEGRELCFDGPRIALPRDYYMAGGVLRIKSSIVSVQETDDWAWFGGKGKILVEGGSLTSLSSLAITNSAELIVCGGTVSCSGYWRVCGSDVPGETGGCIRLTGGKFVYNREHTLKVVQTGGRFENLGGTIVWGRDTSVGQNRLASGTGDYGQDSSFKDFLPPVGGTLIIPTSTEKGALYFNAVDGSYDVGGTLYTTNALSDTAGSVYFYNCNVALQGGSTIYANNLRFYGNGAKMVNLDLSALNLGSGGYVGSGDPITLNYLDGIMFGTWGDWTDANAANVSATIEGPVIFDTKDCFDGMTARRISLDKIDLTAATELTARGEGLVELEDVTFNEEFRKLEVAAGTTLALKGKAPQLKVMNLKLGANATLKVDLAKGGYVDAAATADFDEGAKIVVTALPATLTAKVLYPIYFAPAGTTPDLMRIEVAENVLPSGWELAKTANSVYLTDGQVGPYAASAAHYWIGAGTDNVYSTPENWYENTVGSKTATFNGVFNTDIDVTSSISVRAFSIGAGAGPFVFSGETIGFSYPSSATAGNPSVQNYSAFPVVVENTVKNTADANAVWPLAFNQGSVSLMGGSATKQNFRFGGDIRLGGTWEISSIWASPTYSATAVRMNRLTVMPNATVTVAAQSSDIDVNGAGAASFAIAKDGELVVNGTALVMSSGNVHYVDGSLTVNCPLVSSSRQTFRGDGVLKLLGGVATSATGSVRVEGNLTLVPSNWVNGITLSVKDNVTIAPEDDWTFGGDGALEVVNHSTLTLALCGHKITFAKPIVTEGTVALMGAGKVEIATAGVKVRKVTCANGAKITVAKDLVTTAGFVDVLTVREPDDSIVFDEGLRIKLRIDPTTGEAIYSAKRKTGIILIVR